MAKNTVRVYTTEESVETLEAQIKTIDEQMRELSNKATELQNKVYDLKKLAIVDGLREYCMDPENCYSFVVTFAPFADYHCDLITVYKVLSVQTDSWGPQYKCVVTKLRIADHDMWCRSEVETLSGTSLLHVMQTNETILTNKETAIDELILKMVSCCPTYATYKDYKAVILDKDCRTYGVAENPIGRFG